VSLIHWTPIVRKKPQNVGFLDFVNTFMAISYTPFHVESPPRIFPGVKENFHDSVETKLGDRYLFEKYTEIRINGA
jgi:hypothetical protein